MTARLREVRRGDLMRHSPPSQEVAGVTGCELGSTVRPQRAGRAGCRKGQPETGDHVSCWCLAGAVENEWPPREAVGIHQVRPTRPGEVIGWHGLQDPGGSGFHDERLLLLTGERRPLRLLCRGGWDETGDQAGPVMLEVLLRFLVVLLLFLKRRLVASVVPRRLPLVLQRRVCLSASRQLGCSCFAAAGYPASAELRLLTTDWRTMTFLCLRCDEPDLLRELSVQDAQVNGVMPWQQGTVQLLHHRDGHCPLDVSELQCDIAGSQAEQLPTVRCEQAAGRGRQVLDVDAHPRCLVQRGHRHLSTSVRRPRCLLPATVGAMQHQLNLRGAPGLQTLEHAARTAAGSSGWFRCWRRPCLHSDERHSSASVRPSLGPVHVGCWRAGASGATTAADGREVTHLAAVAAGLTGGPAVTSITVGVASAADAFLLSRPVPPRTAAAFPELPRSRVEAGGWMRRAGGAQCRKRQWGRSKLYILWYRKLYRKKEVSKCSSWIKLSDDILFIDFWRSC